MTALIIILSIILLVVVILQVSKLTDLYARIQGEEEVDFRRNRTQGRLMLVFMFIFLILSVLSATWWKNYMLGYGPHKSASEHGGMLDSIFNTTLLFTGIVFILTHIGLFYFSWKYKGVKGVKAFHWSHNNTLEYIWSAIPAVVMTFLVVQGLIAWNKTMADVAEGEEHIEIEATGYQYAWHLRYPGADGALGTRNFKLISATNPLGQDWSDAKNFDDFHPDEIVLPVNKKVRVRITARDVLHSFFLPHFRVKMDAVPGLPTYFVFTPTKTTEEYRDELRNYPEYQRPADPNDPDSKMLWEVFNYELACAELCGKSHYSMRRLVRIVTEEEYAAWLQKQQSYYLSSIRNKPEDPNIGRLLDLEIQRNRESLHTSIEQALKSEGSVDVKAAPIVIRLDYVQFETGLSNLTEDSRYQLNDLVEILNQHPNIKIEIAGHTDNVGDDAANLTLSKDRANVVRNYLVEKGINGSRLVAAGYGETRPLESNDTEKGRASNRRTEFSIIAQ